MTGWSLYNYLSIVAFLGLIWWGVYRWKNANIPCLSEEECKEYSSRVVAAIFECAPDVGVSIPVKDNYWREVFSDKEWIYLCRWMSGKGMVQLPEDWNMISIILNNPPRELALTQKTWQLQIDNKKERATVTNIGILGDGNYVGENLNVGGCQNNASEVTGENSLTASDVLDLIEALRVDGNSLSGIDRAQIRATADFLEKEIQDGVSPDTMGGDLGKVVTQVSEIVKTGASLMGATVSVLKALGLA